MTLNGAITQLVLLSEHPMMPVIFRPAIQKVIENISELEAQPERRWIPVTVINQNYIPELKDFPYGGFLFTYRTPKGKLLVREAWVERGRIIGRKMNGIPIAYQLKPEPWEGDAE